MKLANLPAVVLATGEPREEGAFEAVTAPAMLPMVDRPLLQHVVESLIDEGVRSVHFVLSSHAEIVEKHFGDGTRWGSRFNYHLAVHPEDAWAVLRRVPLGPELESGPGNVILANGELLPRVHWSQIADAIPLVIQNGGRWTGWAVLAETQMRALSTAGSRSAAAKRLFELVRRSGTQVEAAPVLTTATAGALLDSQNTLLSGAFPGIELWGRETQPGIRTGRHAWIHPTAMLVPPVYVGPDSLVNAFVRLGPNVVLGRECVIAQETSIRDSVVCDGSFVGERLMLDRVLVDQGRLHHVRLDTEFSVPDDLVLDSVHHHWFRDFLHSAISRLSALLLFALLWPLLLIVWINALRKPGRPIWHTRWVLRIPVRERGAYRELAPLSSLTAEEPERLGFASHFFQCFLPGLPQVLAGRLHLVGVPPRSNHQVGGLPREWRNVYLRAKAGLVTEAFVHFRHPADGVEQQASETYFAMFGNLWEDFRVLMRYFLAVARDLRRIVSGKSGSSEIWNS